MPARTFEDKITFVTGATSGIGQGVALAFAREGATVIGCGRNTARGAETQRLIETEGGTFLFLPVDLGDEAQVTGGVQAALDRYGRLDCAANCAGPVPVSPRRSGRDVMTMLTRSAAAECARWGVRINEVSPGPVLTPMTTDSVSAAIPLGGILSPQDIADSVLFLCSPQAATITGATLTVDGGFVLG